jgi:N-terminal half of MaoC dehydratase
MTEKRPPDDTSQLIGMQGEPFELVLERGKIREFARATMAEHPAYWEDSEPVVPPTFLTTTAHWAPHERELLEATGWDRRRMLHAEQEYVFPGPPPRAGMVLRGTTRIESVNERQGRRAGKLRFLVLATEFRDTLGELVALARTTVVETGHAPETRGDSRHVD